MFFRFLLVFFLFFPFVGPMEGIDVQPLFFIYACIFIVFYMNSINFSLKRLSVLTLVLGAISTRFLFEIEYVTFQYITTYLLSVLTPFLLYVLIDNNLLNIDKKSLFYIIAIYVLVAFIQLFYPGFLTWLVARSTEQIDRLIQTGRGVRSLGSEPANYGKMLTGFNILYLFLLIKEGPKKYSFRSAVVGSFFLLFVSAITAQSAYATGIHFGIISIFMIVLKKGKYLVWYITILVIIYVIYDTGLSQRDSRLITMYELLFSNSKLLMNQGAFGRLINIPININNTFYYGSLGAGNSPETFYTYIYTPLGKYFYTVSNRNLGGFVEYFLRFGILSLPFYVIYFLILYRISQIKVFVDNNRYRLGLFFSISIFIYSFQAGTPVNPFTWFLLLYIYYNRKNV